MSTAVANAAATAGSTAACPSAGLTAMRSPAQLFPIRSAADDGGASAHGSRASAPEMTSSSSAASAAVRVIGPAWESAPNGLAG